MEGEFKPYYEGQKAYYAGDQHYDNPYRQYDDYDPLNWNWSQWDAGWWNAHEHDGG